MSEQPVGPKPIFRTQPMTRRSVQREQQLAKQNAATAGDGQYVFENNTRGDLYLPRPTHKGQRLITKNEQFVGDSYYFSLVRSNELKFIREMRDPQQTLLTEQPPTVTIDGQMEVVAEPQTHTTHEILLTECPVEGITIIH